MQSARHCLAALAVFLVAAMSASAIGHFGKTDVFASAQAFSHTTADGVRFDDRAAGFRLMDDPAGGYQRDGTVTSESLHYGFGFNTVVASWNADCPAGTWVKVEVQTSADSQTWTAWYEMAMWGDRALTDKAATQPKVKRDDFGHVNQDTLELKEKATRLRYRVTLHTERPEATPLLTLVAIAVVDKTTEVAPDNTRGPAWGKEVRADFRSQVVENADISWRICGPTSTCMALTAHGIRIPTADVAHAAWDNVNNIYGNWPALAAAASDLMRKYANEIPSVPGKRKAFQAYVLWLPDWKAVENEILNGNPVVVSIDFGKGELRGGPLTETDGHLILARGFTKDGDVICNDPASRTEKNGRVIYNRTELLNARHGGPVIVFHPYE